MRRLNPQELEAARDALTGDAGAKVIEAVFALVLGRTTSPPAALGATLEKLGWLDGNGLTPLGELIGDPVREYVFWLERGRKLHHHDELPQMDPQLYRGKDVLELGSGGGCNLLSLGVGEPRRLVGVDPMPVYLQLFPIFAGLAGVDPAETAEGFGESIPFGAESFDVVFCLSSLQYMDIPRALAEIARVLRPGGEVIVLAPTLVEFIANTLNRFIRSRRLQGAKYAAVSVFNALTFRTLGRRLVYGQSSNTTAYPVYPSLGFFRRLLGEAGLQLVESRKVRLNIQETLVVARKV